ncbi:MAG TPA: amidase [Terriglobia bacterium]|nr:amidase [Terriglobia bacterium]
MMKPRALSRLNRRRFLRAGMLGGVAAAAAPLVARTPGESNSNPPVPPFEFDEITITGLQEGMKSGQLTARSIAEKYLARIDAIDKHGPGLNSVIELNPDALAISDALDHERQAQKVRGPLHGIPILIKDNIATRDRMQTTAGSLALVGSVPPKDAFLVKKLREAGAVILGKTNLSEWANIRSSNSTSGWSGRGGLTHNPYALDRNPSGSSSGSGVAVAANLCAIAIGTETDGSIVSPANNNGIVGIKPTVGLVSRAGIIPIAHSQDTAGPMARTVTDAAILLGALGGMDSDDPATAASRDRGTPWRTPTDYTTMLDAKGLTGARLGVVRKLAGFHDGVDKLLNEAIEVLKRQGAVVVDPANIATLDQLGDAETQVLLYELKTDLENYLAQLGDAAPVHTLKQIIEFNEQHPAQEMPYFGQDLFLKAQEKGSLYRKEYLDNLEKSKTLMRAQGIDAVMDQFKLDALVAPTGAPAWMTDLVDGDHGLGGSSTPAAVAGYPHITVPMGFVFGLPVGISFFGRAWSETTLIKFAYAFEQATRQRHPPRFLATADLSV